MNRTHTVAYPSALLSMLAGIMAVATSLCSTNAVASYITMVTNFSVTVKPEELTLVVTSENRGDVPAHDVQFEIIINDRVLAGPVVEILEQNKKTSAEFTLTDKIGIPGRYPAVIKTYYKDASGHGFTALTVGFYDHHSTIKSTVSISGQASSMPVDGKGQVTFVLRNEGQTEQKIDLALFIPNELSADQEQDVIEIGPQQETTIVFTLENYSALANSSYPVSLVGQYKDAGRHFSMAGSAVVRVTDDVEPTVRLVWIWVLLGGLIPGVIIFQWLKTAAGSGNR